MPSSLVVEEQKSDLLRSYYIHPELSRRTVCEAAEVGMPSDSGAEHEGQAGDARSTINRRDRCLI